MVVFPVTYRWNETIPSRYGTFICILVRICANTVSPTSTPNIIINDDPRVVRDRSHAILSTLHPSSQSLSALLGTGSANEIGKTPDVERNRYQHAISPIFFLSNTSEKFNKVLGVTRSGLVTAPRLLEKSADAFPPLK